MTPSLENAGWRARPSVRAVLAVLGGDGEARVVGGAVRDALLGLDVADIDIATVHPPAEVTRRLEAAGIKVVATGIAHGTVTAVANGEPLEVTTLRHDLSTDGRHATVAFTGEWREDAARRDFTINALYAEGGSGAVHDYFGGIADLAAAHVRFIGEPLQRIAEDHLRILRFFRFHARFGKGAPDPEGLAACTARANDLMALSRERIRAELLRLLAVADPTPTLAVMVRHGILRPVLPEVDEEAVGRLAQLVKLEQSAGVSPACLRRLAALIGDSDTVAARLRLSKEEERRYRTAATAVPGEHKRMSAQAMAYRWTPGWAIDRLLISGAPVDVIVAASKALLDWRKPRLPIGGGELIAMGLPAGPAVSQALRSIEADWIAAGFPADRETVQAIARRRIADRI